MLKDTVPIEIQSFFDYNNNLILKEMGIVSEKDQDLNKSVLREPPYDFTLLNTKFRNMVNQFPSQHFLERWRKQSYLVSPCQQEAFNNTVYHR